MEYFGEEINGGEKHRNRRIYMSGLANKGKKCSCHTYIVPTIICTGAIRAAGDRFVIIALEADQVSGTVRIVIAIPVM